VEKLKFLIIGLIILLSGTAMACAEDVIDFEIKADFFSKYIWRGQNLNDEPVFQPSISAGCEGLTATIWGNLELTSMHGNSGDLSELDYSLDYSASITGTEGVGYSLGVIYYDFPGTVTPDTTELYLGLNFDLPLNQSVTVYHDIDEAEGTYVSLAIEHIIENIAERVLDMPVGMKMGASIGWASGSYNKYYWTTDQSKLQDITISVSFPMGLVGWTLAPSLNYVTLVSNDIRDTDTYGTDSDFFLASVNFSKRF